jgi:hypothetical protein
MIKFSYEVPTPNIWDFLPYQDFIFTLHHLYNNEDYLDFVKIAQYQYDVWLDNSYNEKMKATSVQDLASIYFSLKDVSKVIAPDDPSWSTAQIQESAEDLGILIGMDKVLIVVNSPDMMHTIKSNIEISDPEKFAVSYWVRPKMTTAELKEFKGTHFLGLLNPQELIDYQPTSVDTSMPIKLALLDKTFNEWLKEGCPHIHTKDLGEAGADYFNTKLTEHQLELSFKNIEALEKYVK